MLGRPNRERRYINIWGCAKWGNYLTETGHACENSEANPIMTSFFFVSYIFVCSFLVFNLFIGTAALLSNDNESIHDVPNHDTDVAPSCDAPGVITTEMQAAKEQFAERELQYKKLAVSLDRVCQDGVQYTVVAS